jgi:uncharacterized protein (DUF736 family)
MANVGTFKFGKDNVLTGEIDTLTFSAVAKLVLTGLTGEKSPKYRVFAGSGFRAAIGSVWEKISEEKGL